MRDSIWLGLGDEKFTWLLDAPSLMLSSLQRQPAQFVRPFVGARRHRQPDGSGAQLEIPVVDDVGAHARQALGGALLDG